MSLVFGSNFSILSAKARNYILASSIVLIAVVIILAICLEPPHLEVTVTNASLAQFNLSSNKDTLYYNIALTMNTRNVKRTVSSKDVLYSKIEANAKYKNEIFANWTLSSTPFKQQPKNTTVLQYRAIRGQQPVRFSEEELSEFNGESAIGVYSIEVVVSMKVKTRTSFTYEWTCPLKIPMSSNQTRFGATWCSTHDDERLLRARRLRFFS